MRLDAPQRRAADLIGEAGIARHLLQLGPSSDYFVCARSGSWYCRPLRATVWSPQKEPAWSETREIATSLKSGDRNNKTSIDDEILLALAERLGRFVRFLVLTFR